MGHAPSAAGTFRKKNPEKFRKDPGNSLRAFLYTEQMDAEGLGRKLLLTPSGDPRRALKSRPWVLCLHLKNCQPCKHFRALSMPALHLSMPALQRGAAWVEERLLSRTFR